jgi:phosphate:Na+ symporter
LNRVKRGQSFSKESEDELRIMMERLIGNLRAAASLFMTADPRAGRLLAEEKRVFGDAEATAMRAQFERPRSEASARTRQAPFTSIFCAT